jgi:signal transduction histidine kinase
MTAAATPASDALSRATDRTTADGGRSTVVTAAAALLTLTPSVAALVIARGGVTATMAVVVALGLGWTVAGCSVATRKICPIGLIGQSIAMAIGLGVLAWSVERHRDLSSRGEVLAEIVQRAALVALPALVFHLFLTLPNGSASRPSHRRALVAAYTVAALVGVALMFDRDHIHRWPIGVLWLATLVALPAAHHNYRKGAVSDQRRLQWIGWSIAVAAEIALVSASLAWVTGWPGGPAAVALAATGLVPLAIAAGTVDRMVARVDRLLTHTMSLTGLTALVVAAYLVAIAAFGRKPEDGERTLLLLSMVAAGGAALAYQPARGRLVEFANRIVYGERLSPDEALRTWGSRLTRAIPMDELLLQLVETLRKSMQLQSAQIWTGCDRHFEVAAMVPHRARDAYTVGSKEEGVVARAGVSGGTWLDIWLPGLVGVGSAASTRVAPIAHAGALLGLIVCERPCDAAAFTEEDDRVLTELARQVGVALHNVQLDTALQASLDELRHTNEELRASRSRIVAAGDSERRKLERNLHDGAQQHLVALAVQLRLAKDALVDTPDDVEGMLDEIRAGLQDAIIELRALAHGIFPPLLISGGLAEALPASAARAALPTATDIVVDRHDQEVEAAVYFCCMEALQNAGKHAGDSASVVLRVWQDDGAVHWEVSDDGLGFDTSSLAGDGHGFVNMRDRMGAFGGTIEVISGPGRGTTIRGHVPLTA